MSVNLYTQQGIDFDMWFGIGTGSQWLSIVGNSGQDIGQRYTAGSGGPATGWYTSDGQDICNKLGGYGYGLYRVAGYPWNYYHADFNITTHVNYWKSWLQKWATQKQACKCVSGITDDCWYRNVHSDYHYSVCIFGYAPNGNGMSFNYNLANVWSDCSKHKEITLQYIEISSYLKGVVVRPTCGAGDYLVGEVRTSMSQAGSPSVEYRGAFGIANDDNNPVQSSTAWGYSNWGKNWWFHA